MLLFTGKIFKEVVFLKKKLLLGTCIVLATFAMTACNTKKEKPVESETKRKIANVANSEENNLSKEPFALNYLKVQDNAPYEITFKDISVDRRMYTLSCKANVTYKGKGMEFGHILAFQNGVELDSYSKTATYMLSTDDEEDFDMSFALEDLSDVTIVVSDFEDNIKIIEVPIDERCKEPGEAVSGLEYVEHGKVITGGVKEGYVDFIYTNTSDKIASAYSTYSFTVYQNDEVLYGGRGDLDKNIFPGYTQKVRITYDLPYSGSGVKIVVTDVSNLISPNEQTGNVLYEIALD